MDASSLRRMTFGHRVITGGSHAPAPSYPQPQPCPPGTISRRILLRGQFFPQFLRRQLEALPETQLGEIQAQQAVRRLILAAAGAEAAQVPVQALQVQ